MFKITKYIQSSCLPNIIQHLFTMTFFFRYFVGNMQCVRTASGKTILRIVFCIISYNVSITIQKILKNLIFIVINNYMESKSNSGFLVFSFGIHQWQTVWDLPVDLAFCWLCFHVNKKWKMVGYLHCILASLRHECYQSRNYDLYTSYSF